jgi:hypothetical protein
LKGDGRRPTTKTFSSRYQSSGGRFKQHRTTALQETFFPETKVSKLQVETTLTQHTRYFVPIWIELVNIKPKDQVIFAGEVGSEILPGPAVPQVVNWIP